MERDPIGSCVRVPKSVKNWRLEMVFRFNGNIIGNCTCGIGFIVPVPAKERFRHNLQ